MIEFINTAQKHNSSKMENRTFNTFDEIFFKTYNSFFEKNEKYLKNQLAYFTEAFGRLSIYLKEYLANARTKLQERNFVSSEYYKNKIALNEKKNKTILLDNTQWGITREQCQQFNLVLEKV